MKISEKGLELIKSFEGCKLTAYKCPAGVWTIGWGHTSDVKEGQTITQEQANQMLKDDMVAYELKVEKYNNTYKWNQNEFDALTSFAYNVGSIDQLTARGTRTRAVIAEKMLAYNKGGGKVLAGLTRRRQAEQELFLTPAESSVVSQQEPHWVKCGDRWQYLQADGTYMCAGWLLINHHWYLFDHDGWMLTGWQNVNGEWFYLEESGDYEGACWHESEKRNGSQERWYVE